MIIGLTGGIASGKTLVSDYLKGLGYPVVDADLLSREVMAQPETLAAVRAAFGDGVFCADGSLDRAALARRVFSDAGARQRLDAITHPAIEKLAQARFAEYGEATLVFFVVPLLYESGMDALCDRVWLVHADAALREKRLMARDAIDADYARQKIAAQMSEEERLARGPRVLTNDGDSAHLYEQIQTFLKNP